MRRKPGKNMRRPLKNVPTRNAISGVLLGSHGSQIVKRKKRGKEESRNSDILVRIIAKAKIKNKQQSIDIS
jgi:hypothetical protein